MTENKVIYMDTDTVKCSGENDDHPAVYYTVPKDGEVMCGYCGLIFRRQDNKI